MALSDNLKTANIARLESTLRSAVNAYWSVLMPEGATGQIHIEYQSDTDGALEFIKIWESTVWGVWNLICEFWIYPRWSHATGIRFGKNFQSVSFARALELVVGSMKTTLSPPNYHGLIQSFPPTAAEQTEAREVVNESITLSGTAPLTSPIAA
jgi:hypothetical protein